mmetsp:Transcript_25967/g.60947  ORF Transcript_25967/g.60947 Transcript_25967/m.60947 type:complete len:277 (+) Transcript_25967:1273-2103(+)
MPRDRGGGASRRASERDCLFVGSFVRLRVRGMTVSSAGVSRRWWIRREKTPPRNPRQRGASRTRREATPASHHPARTTTRIDVREIRNRGERREIHLCYRSSSEREREREETKLTRERCSNRCKASARPFWSPSKMVCVFLDFRSSHSIVRVRCVRCVRAWVVVVGRVEHPSGDGACGKIAETKMNSKSQWQAADLDRSAIVADFSTRGTGRTRATTPRARGLERAILRGNRHRNGASGRRSLALPSDSPTLATPIANRGRGAVRSGSRAGRERES